MAEEVFEYINERLFTEEKPVLFTDLICRFKVGPSKAKYLMYSYYKQNTSTKFNCIIICVGKDGSIKVVNDLDSFDDQQTLADCFIYALNTTDIFTPVSIARDLHDFLPIRNCFDLKVVPKRAKTLDAEPTAKPSPLPTARSRTVPEAKETTRKPPAKSKNTGLRSTAILAKMRGERERKERERREELQRRRQEQVERETKNDKKRSAQMAELDNLFDDEDDMPDEKQPSATPEPYTATPEREESTPLDKQELEELLETTADDSLMHTKNAEEQDTPETRPGADSSYVDEDGYTVTNRAATSTPPQKPAHKRPSTASKPDVPAKRAAAKGKTTQGTLESFFQKR
ncbi:hypothetical protein HG536_0G03800 [Torulaspora globosa]|uniref:DNA polymerase delta subunit 3 n=1 Tax=Torulaspora globosa TaxID=48254 RepID=A0A7G3ZLY2_9SACH|nr:uncharacterized protein HG536_0G03800 [Torulaspora globosa]QLL34518.1 hypothetical protein HG536_0G03800 [Torulaspora globosa]